MHDVIGRGHSAMTFFFLRVCLEPTSPAFAERFNYILEVAFLSLIPRPPPVLTFHLRSQ